jgi:hypothetical protein
MTFYLIDQISGCTDPSLVECTGYDFCCPAGEACSLDANGNAQCGGVSVGNGNGNGSSTTTTPVGNPATTTTPVGNPLPTTTPLNNVPGTTTTPQFTVINTNTLGNGNGGMTITNLPATTPLETTNPSSKTTDNSGNSGSQGGAGRLDVGVGAAVCVFATLVGAMVF